MKFLFLYYPKMLTHFILLRARYFYEDFVFKHISYMFFPQAKRTRFTPMQYNFRFLLHRDMNRFGKYAES